MTALESAKWQPVPGFENVELYPFIRKPDIVSCNSYILRASGELIIIDPGADAEQMARILEIVQQGVAAGLDATFYLTHCHVDHCFQIVSAYRSEGNGSIKLAVQEAGAEALRSLDPDLTQARVMGWTFPPSSLQVRCSSLLDGRELTGEVSLGTKMDIMPTCEGLTLRRQIVPLDGGVMEVFHTPGHSPDSVCYMVGRVLFTGDLLFAADPGIAGQVGWNRDDLVTSVRNVLWLLKSREIDLCCPGHGRPVDTETARAILEGMLQRAGELGSIRTNDLDRIRFTSDYALDILMEANEAFSVLAGRLYYLSYYLEELEESEEARRCRECIESDKIDELLAKFHHFVEEFLQGQKVQLQVILKAIQTIQSIERLFRGTKLEELMDASVLRRTSRLLGDFTNAVKGLEFDIEMTTAQLDVLIDRTIGTLASPPPPEEEILDAVGDDQAYLAALARRIAHLPIYDGMTFSVRKEGDADITVRIDEGRFVDALCGLLEEYVGLDAREIALQLIGGYRPTVAISADVEKKVLDREKERSHRRRFELAGAKLKIAEDPACLIIEMEAPGGNG